MKRTTGLVSTLVAVIAVMTFGVGTAADAHRRSAHDTPELRAALNAWSSFPARSQRRPLVLTSDPVVPGGFPSNDTKEAFLSGLVDGPATLPQGPTEADGVPLMSSEEALAFMQSNAAPGPGHPTPLVIDDVSLGTGSFGTDRGVQALPAWLFHFQGVTNPAAVLAVATSARFRPPVDDGPPNVAARLATDGRTLALNFIGARAGHGPCSAHYRVDHLGSNAAVAISIRETRSTGGVCPDVAYQRHLLIRLKPSLGGRVLVDAKTKAPVAVAS